jgi:hypothetical protein
MKAAVVVVGVLALLGANAAVASFAADVNEITVKAKGLS